MSSEGFAGRGRGRGRARGRGGYYRSDGPVQAAAA